MFANQYAKSAGFMSDDKNFVLSFVGCGIKIRKKICFIRRISSQEEFDVDNSVILALSVCYIVHCVQYSISIVSY